MIVIIGVLFLTFLITVLTVISKGDKVKDNWDMIIILPIVFTIIITVVVIIVSVMPGGLTQTDSETVALCQISDVEGVSGYLTTNIDDDAKAVYTYVTADGETCEVSSEKAIVCSSENTQAYVEVTTYERTGITNLLLFNLCKKEVVTFYIP